MALTQQQFNKLAKQAMNDYAKKLKLEQPLAKQVSTLFKKVSADVTAHGTSHLETYRKELETILNDHHIKTASQFSSNLRNIIGTPSNDKAMQRKLDANIKGYAAQRSHLMSHKIMDTTANNIDKAMKDASIEAALSEEALHHADISEIAGKIVKERLVNRVPTIATTETQAGAESGKWLELDTMIDTGSEIDGESIKEMTQKKVWITVLDDHTRPDHVEADAQEQNIDDPFEVGGEELMYPGDENGSEEQICNCRCSMEYIVE
jgi:hypothetical protein